MGAENRDMGTGQNGFAVAVLSGFDSSFVLLDESLVLSVLESQSVCPAVPGAASTRDGTRPHWLHTYFSLPVAL